MNWQATEIKARERIVIALDLATGEEALALVRKLSPHAGLFKIGLQLYTVAGPGIVRAVRDLGGRIFLDLKLHDIPNTVDRAVERQLVRWEMQTIHLSGGRAMIEPRCSLLLPKCCLGVTVLTVDPPGCVRPASIRRWRTSPASRPTGEWTAYWRRRCESARDCSAPACHARSSDRDTRKSDRGCGNE